MMISKKINYTTQQTSTHIKLTVDLWPASFALSGPRVNRELNKCLARAHAQARTIKYEGTRWGKFRFLSYYDTHSDFCGELFCTNSKLFD